MTEPPAAPSNTRLRAAAALLVGLVILVYGQTLGHGFVTWDDPAYITANPHVIRGVSFEDTAWAFTHARASNWHPLTWISHQLDVELFGLHAGAHHAVSAALHAASAVLLLILLMRLTGSFGPSLVVAALFACHPLRVESVAWASERKDVLSGLFFMLALLAWVPAPGRARRTGLCALALACGLMAKPMLVTFPVVLLLLDVWPLRRWRGTAPDDPQARTALELLREKLPFIALCAAAVATTLWAQGRSGALMSLERIPADVRLANIPTAYLGYLGKAFWPVDLALFYPLQADLDATRLGMVGAALAALVLVTVLALRARRRAGAVFTGWFLYLVMLLPVIGVVQVGTQAMADRYAYLPLLGIEILVVFEVWRWVSPRPLWRRAAAVSAILVVAALALRAHGQVQVWRGNHELYTHALAIDPENPVAHNNLGLVFLKRGDLDAATTSFEQAAHFAPGFAQAWVNLGTARRLAGAHAEAHQALDRALDLDPGGVDTLLALAQLLLDEGQLDGAAKRIKRLMRLAPGKAQTHVLRGRLLLARERPDEAAAAFQEALRIDPANVESARWLAEAHALKQG